MTGQWIDDKTYWEDPKDKPAFALGDRVEKVGGRYGGYGEFVHVFPAAVLKKLER